MSRQIFSICIHVLASRSSIPLHGVCRLSVLSWMSRQIFSICIHVLASRSSIPLHGVCRLSVLSWMSRQISTVVAHVIGTHTVGSRKVLVRALVWLLARWPSINLTPLLYFLKKFLPCKVRFQLSYGVHEDWILAGNLGSVHTDRDRDR